MRDEDGERLRRRAEDAGGGEQRQRRRNAHGADPDRIDVVEVGALELDAGRRQAEALVDGEVGDDRAQPGDGDDREQAEDHLQRRVDAELHQHQRDRDVEDQPDDAAGMAVGQPREEVRPGQRPGIGVHDVDLELRHHHEGGGQEQHEILPGNDVAEGNPVHLGGLGGVLRRHPVAERQHRQERAEQAASARRAPPSRGRRAAPRSSRACWSPPTGMKRSTSTCSPICGISARMTRGRGAELQQVEAGIGRAETGEVAPDLEAPPVLPGDEADRQDVEADPQGLGDELEAADARHAVGDQRDHRDGADDVADGQRNAEAQLERRRHDRGFDGEEDEGEGGVDQRGDGRADIAEAGAAGEQVDVDAVARGVARHRQAGEEQEDAGDDGGGDGVGDAVGERDRPADRLQRQEGDGADGGLRDARGRPAPRALGGEAQRIVFQRLVGDPAIVFATDRQDSLSPRHRCFAPASFRCTLPFCDARCGPAPPKEAGPGGDSRAARGPVYVNRRICALTRTVRRFT